MRPAAPPQIIGCAADPATTPTNAPPSPPHPPAHAPAARHQHLLWISLRKMHPRAVIHQLFQALVERPAHCILPARHRAELRRQHHAVEVHLVDAKHIQRPLQVVLEERVVTDRITRLADQFDGLVHVGVVGELHREKRIGELPRLVGHRLDLAERHRMHEPLAVTQAQGADGQALRPYRRGRNRAPPSRRSTRCLQ